MISVSVAKAAPIAAPSILGVAAALVDPHGVLRLIGVIVGLVFAAAWRGSMLAEKNRPWPEIRKDLLISTLIGGVNATIALMIVERVGAGILLSIFIAAMVGSTGVRALPMIRDFFLNELRNRVGAAPRKDDE